MAKKYKIKMRRCYYQGTYVADKSDRRHYVTDALGNDIVGNRDMIESYIADLEAGVYVMAHGEVTRPDYKIVKA